MKPVASGQHPASGVLGIDFGTSNSAIAWAQSGHVRALALEADATTLPTAIFYNAEERSTHFGRDAIARYLEGTEGRLMRSLKSLLGSPLLQEQTVVHGQQISFQDIITQFLQEMRQRALLQLGLEGKAAQQALRRVMLGRPVHFVDDDPQRDQLAQATLLQCAKSAGFEDVQFQLEPIAAAFDYERQLTQPQRVLVADIGGGTSDFTVVRLRPAAPVDTDRSGDILATTGVHIGGTDFDQKLNLELVMPLLGLRHIGPRGREVPSAVFFDLATWHLINWRYSAKALREAQDLRSDYTDLQLHQRLMRVLDERLGHRIAHEVEQAKIQCSDSASPSPLDLSCIESGLQAAMDMPSLQQHLRAPLERVVACAQACWRQAGPAHETLDAIYLTGGSSALLPFQQALAAAFPGVTLVRGDLFGGVAAGLAFAGQAGQNL